MADWYSCICAMAYWHFRTFLACFCITKLQSYPWDLPTHSKSFEFRNLLVLDKQQRTNYFNYSGSWIPDLTHSRLSNFKFTFSFPSMAQFSAIFFLKLVLDCWCLEQKIGKIIQKAKIGFISRLFLKIYRYLFGSNLLFRNDELVLSQFAVFMILKLMVYDKLKKFFRI